MTWSECAPRARLSRVVFGSLAAVALAGCATAPRGPGTRPVDRAIAASARRGNPMAQLRLGAGILRQARNRRQRAAGVAWIRRAAGANLAMAQDRLGAMYLTGRCVPQDTDRALKWLHRAAERDAPAAQLMLGELYAVGSLVPVDKAKAYYWYSIAAKPVRSDVTIFNIDQVRFFARNRALALAASLTPAERASVGRRVAAWAPARSVPYSGVVPLRGYRR